MVNKISRSRNNKELKFSQEIIDYDISNFEVEVQYNSYKIYPDLNFIKNIVQKIQLILKMIFNL